MIFFPGRSGSRWLNLLLKLDIGYFEMEGVELVMWRAKLETLASECLYHLVWWAEYLNLRFWVCDADDLDVPSALEVSSRAKTDGDSCNRGDTGPSWPDLLSLSPGSRNHTTVYLRLSFCSVSDPRRTCCKILWSFVCFGDTPSVF